MLRLSNSWFLQAWYAYMLYAGGIEPLFIGQEALFLPVDTESQRIGQYPYRVIPWFFLQIGLNAYKIRGAVTLHYKAETAVGRANIIGQKAKHHVAIHLAKIIAQGGGSCKGIVPVIVHVGGCAVEVLQGLRLGLGRDAGNLKKPLAAIGTGSGIK